MPQGSLLLHSVAHHFWVSSFGHLTAALQHFECILSQVCQYTSDNFGFGATPPPLDGLFSDGPPSNTMRHNGSFRVVPLAFWRVFLYPRCSAQARNGSVLNVGDETRDA